MSPVTSAPDPEAEMATFAWLLAARHDAVRLIEKGNTARHARWPQWAPAQPVAVYLARRGRFRTVVLDFDARLGGPQRAARDADVAVHVLTRCGIPAVVVASGPTGGRHVLATVTAPGLSARDARRLVEALRRLPLPSLDPTPMLNPATGCIRPPLAPHRLGGRSRILGDHTVAREALSRGAAPARYRSLIRCLAGPRSGSTAPAPPQGRR